MIEKVESVLDGAIKNWGNLRRIKEKMEKAKKGEAITVGFLGGSITMGSLAIKSKTKSCCVTCKQRTI